MRHHDPIPPGTRIGILGAGQLGKMIAIAAARLGYETVIWSPEGDIPAMQVASYPIIAPYDNEEALHRFVNLAAVATLEFENIPVALVEKIAEHIPTRPNAAVLRVTQDRWEEKDFFQRMRIPITRTVRAEVVFDGHAEFPFPAILKTCRLGYDGHGQIRVKNLAELRDAYATLGHVPCVLEEEVDFLCEISVIAARGIAEQKHEIRCYPAVHNVHSNGILRETKWPSSAVTRAVEYEAKRIAEVAAETLGVQGLLAVEMFVTKDGRVLANEMAPRPHNSGHGTIDACYTDQYEQLVRAICGHPLGDPTPHSAWRMENLLGDQLGLWQYILRQPSAKLHLYGKGQVRPGRKMGHVTFLSPR